MTLQNELSKLLREQEQLLQNQKENGGEYCYALERNNKEVWALRSKYACGSTWDKDPAFDKWWVKQVAKARNLNMTRQILIYAFGAAFWMWLLFGTSCQKQYDRTHQATEEVEPDDN